MLELLPPPTRSGLPRSFSPGEVGWIAPTLPAGAPATNWLPIPSISYYTGIYPGVKVPTQIRPLIRIYYPTPGSNTQASILPPPGAAQGATYVFPALQKVS